MFIFFKWFNFFWTRLIPDKKIVVLKSEVCLDKIISELYNHANCFSLLLYQYSKKKIFDKIGNGN